VAVFLYTDRFLFFYYYQRRRSRSKLGTFECLAGKQNIRLVFKSRHIIPKVQNSISTVAVNNIKIKTDKRNCQYNDSRSSEERMANAGIEVRPCGNSVLLDLRKIALQC
jgi:hypothetical protein